MKEHGQLGQRAAAARAGDQGPLKHLTLADGSRYVLEPVADAVYDTLVELMDKLASGEISHDDLRRYQKVIAAYERPIPRKVR